MKTELIDIKNLSVEFKYGLKKIIAVNNISLNIKSGEIVGLVGESGSGKSMTALSMLRLIPFPGNITRGTIFFEDKDLLKLNNEDIRGIRGKKISMIFQDPLSSLNPSFRIGAQVKEILNNSISISKEESVNLIVKTFKRVYLPRANEVFYQYPHQLSGGMRQRVIIAMSIILNPRLILADEATTALDVTTQNQIFDLIEELRQRYNLSFLIISHNLHLIGERCDRIYVMYAGQIVEEASPYSLFSDPIHPYTISLVKSTPNLKGDQERLEIIEGEIPDLSSLPSKGCFFQDRCKFVEGVCKEILPELRLISEERFVRCHKC